jgi:CubicO group peptidase (beta-lactamase class C family)
MRHRRAAAVLLLFGAGPLAAQPGPLRGFDAYVTQAIREWEAPGLAVAVVRNDSVVYARGFGVRELGKSDSVTANTLFAVGSTTKAFTSALLGMLVDEGKVRWDDPVTRHLPRFQLYDPYVTREMTVRDLLTHRSGLSRGDRLWSASGFTREEVLRRVRFLKPTWSLRSNYGYQNIMYLAAGELAAAMSGGTWDQAVQDRIFRPLGMRRTVTSVLSLKQLDDVATPHDRIDGSITPVEWLNIDNIGPAGSINSSVTDMAQWIRLQLGGGTYAGRKLIDTATVKEMHTIQMHIRPSENDEKLWPESHIMGYGLAWALRD